MASGRTARLRRGRRRGRVPAGSRPPFSPRPRRMRHDYHASKRPGSEARRLRRIQRKKDRGQPQALRDIEFS